MNALVKAGVMGLVFLAFASVAQAQVQSTAPADKAMKQKIAQALIKAGVDPRITSVQVITTADHVVYLKGLISDPNTVALAANVAAKTAPNYRVVNEINSSFFADPNHVTGGMSK